jgi:predicted alpha/beta-hydrolase family hydrolase
MLTWTVFRLHAMISSSLIQNHSALAHFGFIQPAFEFDFYRGRCQAKNKKPIRRRHLINEYIEFFMHCPLG